MGFIASTVSKNVAFANVYSKVQRCPLKCNEIKECDLWCHFFQFNRVTLCSNLVHRTLDNIGNFIHKVKGFIFTLNVFSFYYVGK